MPPDFDRDYERVVMMKWRPGSHRRCFLMQRMAIMDLLLHCRFRESGIGVIPPQILVDAILPNLVVYVPA